MEWPDSQRLSSLLFSAFFATLALTAMGVSPFFLLVGLGAFVWALGLVAISIRHGGQARVAFVSAVSYCLALLGTFILATPIVVSREGYFLNGAPWPVFQQTFDLLANLAPAMAGVVALAFLWEALSPAMRALSLAGLAGIAYALAFTVGGPLGDGSGDLTAAYDAAKTHAYWGRIAFAGGALLIGLGLFRAQVPGPAAPAVTAPDA